MLYLQSVQFSHSLVSDSLWPHGLQQARLPCPSPTPRIAQTNIHRVSDAIQPFHPLSSPSPPAFNLFQHQGLFQWVSSYHWACQVALVVKKPACQCRRQEMQVWTLGWEDPLEKEAATHSSILAWEIPWTEELGRLQSMGWQRVGHDWATNNFSLSEWE